MRSAISPWPFAAMAGALPTQVILYFRVVNDDAISTSFGVGHFCHSFAILFDIEGTF